jgi:predicted nucleotidyltransferase
MPLSPVKVILFGSYAKGTATEDSDIDLAVVVPGGETKTYDERVSRYMPVSIALDALQKQYAMDIVVRSTADRNVLCENKDNFWQEVEDGEVLYAR